MSEVMVSVLQCLGPICFIGLQISSLSTALQILHNKSVGMLSSIPFLSLLVNCIVWSLYGWLKQDFTVFAPNFSGILVSLFCLYAFSKYNVTNQFKQHGVSAAIILI